MIVLLLFFWYNLVVVEVLVNNVHGVTVNCCWKEVVGLVIWLLLNLVSPQKLSQGVGLGVCLVQGYFKKTVVAHCIFNLILEINIVVLDILLLALEFLELDLLRLQDLIELVGFVFEPLDLSLQVGHGLVVDQLAGYLLGFFLEVLELFLHASHMALKETWA